MMGTIKEGVEKLKLNQPAIWALLAVGILLMLTPTLMGGSKIPVGNNAGATYSATLESSVATVVANEGQALSQQAEEILGAIKGAGEVRVMILLRKSSGQEEAQGFTSNSTRQYLGPEIRGILITASGAGNPMVRWQIYQAAAALFDMSGARIYVVEGGN